MTKQQRSLERAKVVGRLYKLGLTCREMSEILGKDYPGYSAFLVSYYRRKFPEMFL